MARHDETAVFGRCTERLAHAARAAGARHGPGLGWVHEEDHAHGAARVHQHAQHARHHDLQAQHGQEGDRVFY